MISKFNVELINFLCFFFLMNYFRYYSDVVNYEVMFFIFIIVELILLLCLVIDIYLFNFLNQVLGIIGLFMFNEFEI